MASPDDSAPPWRLGTPNDSLSRFTSLLGTFELKKDAGEAKKPLQAALVPSHDALKKLLVCGKSDETEDCTLSFPSLSLMEEDHHAAVGSDKHEVQARAALNLSRSLTLSQEYWSLPKVSTTNSYVESPYDALATDKDPKLTRESFGCIGVDNITEVPSMMLKNLAGSFALLVDARLRAYVTILARHGVALAESSEVPEERKEEATRAVERKLASLLDIGSRMTIDNMVTNFHSRATLGMSSCVGDGVEAIMIPLVMSAVLDITIPKVNSGLERVTVSLQTAGAISGVCAKGSTLFKSVYMELDTNQLMSSMVLKAAKVSSIALDHVNEANFHVEYAVPDPTTTVPTKRKCHVVADLPFKRPPVVSPDHCAVSPPTGPSPLILDDDGPELTLECCASIVDCAIGEINEDFMTPLCKKMKLDYAPLL